MRYSAKSSLERLSGPLQLCRRTGGRIKLDLNTTSRLVSQQRSLASRFSIPSRCSCDKRRQNQKLSASITTTIPPSASSATIRTPRGSALSVKITSSALNVSFQHTLWAQRSATSTSTSLAILIFARVLPLGASLPLR